MQRNSNIRFRVFILGLYLLILPIDATLGNIMGSISAVNYIVIFYSVIRIFTLYKEKIKISTLVKCKMPFIYFVYFMLSISWSITRDVNDWYIFSLMGAFMIFIFAAIDTYSNYEYIFLRRMIIFSGVVVILITLLNMDLSSATRFALNIGREMDPNYFATGFILITAILMDNILNKKNVKINLSILALLFVVIIMTGSRGGLLSNSFVILSSIIIYRKDQFKKISLIISGFLIFSLLFYFIREFIPEWVLNRFTINELTSGGGSGRLTIWLSNLSYFENENVFRVLFGNGFAAFSFISLISLGVPRVAHSIYVQSLIEGGILGLLIIILLIIVAMKYSWKNNKKYVFSALVGIVIGGIFLDIHVSRFFWMVLFFSILTQSDKQNNIKSDARNFS